MIKRAYCFAISSVPLSPAPSPRKEGKGKNGSGSPSLFTGEGLSFASERGVGDRGDYPPYLRLLEAATVASFVLRNHADEQYRVPLMTFFVHAIYEPAITYTQHL